MFVSCNVYSIGADFIFKARKSLKLELDTILRNCQHNKKLSEMFDAAHYLRSIRSFCLPESQANISIETQTFF